MGVKYAAFQLALGAAAGYAATRLTHAFRAEPSRTDRMPEDVRHRAVERIAHKLDIHFNPSETDDLADSLQALAGLAWGPVYALHRASGLQPAAAGLVTGTHMALMLNEGLIPMLGLRAPGQAYPPSAHLRDWLDCLSRGLAVAVMTESLTRMADTARRRVQTWA